MTCRSVDRRIDVDGGRLAVTAYLPESVTTDAVLFLFPGGGYGRHYFDLRVDGHPDHSQARWHAERGLLTVAVDHLGVGESTVPEHPLGFAEVAAAGDSAVRALVAEIRAGTLDADLPAVPGAVAIGAGQSMGGHVVVVTQAAHDTFAAVAALGSSFTQTRLAVRPGARQPFRGDGMAAVYAGMGDVDFTASFHWPEEPPELVALDMDAEHLAPWRSATVPGCAVELMEPLAVARQAAAVRVPVLLVYGEQDVTVEPLADLAVFRSAPDLSLLLVPRSAHMHNFAPTRHLVWARLESFAEQVLVRRRLLADAG
ncbi:alpha/beta hydrolase [Blastococcus sp. TF02A-26]|uniref:alpha/beta hydrolase n=1 Tax=Blastococcus sp. TF02A-26 TaxID=2250577 RepID=UPI000DE84A2F|nr:alpha/beta hydrolase [Blastococcus sp. TF02A-26]RBY85281.1 alpha/beta hydrolase [Blastococcus sp. TF02A-26]